MTYDINSEEYKKKRDSKINVIKKLMEVNLENGNSETELLYAIEQIDKLMKEYNISLSEVEIKDSKYVNESFYNTDKKKMPYYLLLLSSCIGELFDCATSIKYENYSDYETGRSKRASGVKIDVYGTELDVNLCKYTFDILLNKIGILEDKYKASEQYILLNKLTHGTKIINSYRLGVVHKIIKKVRTLIDDRVKYYSENTPSNTTSLIINKYDLVLKSQKDELCLSGKYKSGGSLDVSPLAYKQGLIDGNNLELTTGISDGDEPLKQLENMSERNFHKVLSKRSLKQRIENHLYLDIHLFYAENLKAEMPLDVSLIENSRELISYYTKKIYDAFEFDKEKANVTSLFKSFLNNFHQSAHNAYPKIITAEVINDNNKHHEEYSIKEFKEMYGKWVNDGSPS